MGVIPGHIRDEVVVVGNHRDGESCFEPYCLHHVDTFLAAWVRDISCTRAVYLTFSVGDGRDRPVFWDSVCT